MAKTKSYRPNHRNPLIGGMNVCSISWLKSWPSAVLHIVKRLLCSLIPIFSCSLITVRWDHSWEEIVSLCSFVSFSQRPLSFSISRASRQVLPHLLLGPGELTTHPLFHYDIMGALTGQSLIVRKRQLLSLWRLAEYLASSMEQSDQHPVRHPGVNTIC